MGSLCHVIEKILCPSYLLYIAASISVPFFITFYSVKVVKGILLLTIQAYKSLCHESILIPNVNRLLITLFIPYHFNITSDVFVVWLSK